MADVVIEQKIESLRRCVERVASCCPATVDELARDIDAQDIVSLNLSRAVQLCVDMAAHWLAQHSQVAAPQTMGQAFTQLAVAGKIDEVLAERLRKMVGFRNIVVHDYQAINWDIVFRLRTRHLDDFKQFARAFAGDA